jgi:hypothetical protein
MVQKFIQLYLNLLNIYTQEIDIYSQKLKDAESYSVISYKVINGRLVYSNIDLQSPINLAGGGAYFIELKSKLYPYIIEYFAYMYLLTNEQREEFTQNKPQNEYVSHWDELLNGERGFHTSIIDYANRNIAGANWKKQNLSEYPSRKIKNKNEYQRLLDNYNRNQENSDKEIKEMNELKEWFEKVKLDLKQKYNL